MVDQPFHVRDGTPRGLLIAVAVTFVFMVPVALITWHAFGGGHEEDVRRRMEQLVRRAPLQDARDAVAAGDFRLYITGDPLDLFLPGCRDVQKPWLDVFGSKPVETCTGKNLAPELKALNDSALAYLAAYNKMVREAVEKLQPDWRRKAEKP